MITRKTEISKIVIYNSTKENSSTKQEATCEAEKNVPY